MVEQITVPICNSCNKPHYGRSKSADRCCCDISGNYHYGKIDSELMELIPNCSEMVMRIELTGEEVKDIKFRLMQISDSGELDWDYIEEYLNSDPGEFIFMGSEEEKAINEALRGINKGDELNEE